MAHTRDDCGDTMALSASSVSPLLELPSELRNMIYRMVLVSEEPIETNRTIVRKPVARMQLLQVCRQVREEAHDIFWSENAFRFTSKGWQMYQEYNLLGKVGAKKASLIKHLTIEMQQSDSHRTYLDTIIRHISHPKYFELMDTTGIRNETYHLLQYGVPASSVHLVTPPVLEPTANDMHRFLARMYREFNDSIRRGLKQSQHIMVRQPTLEEKKFSKVKFGNIQLGILSPKDQ